VWQSILTVSDYCKVTDQVYDAAMNQGYVASAIQAIGLTKLGDRLNFWPSAIQKWRDDDRLPATELSGLTNYAPVIAEMAEAARTAKKPIKGERFTAEKLIEATRANWQMKIAKKANKGGAA
jgi:hypothetical protein